MKQLVSALAAAAVLALPTAAPALEDDEIGVLRLFDEFVSSGAAASQCAAPDDLVAARFLSNFQWVSMQAHREAGRQMPNSTPQQVADELARRSKAVKDSTHAMVRAEGCEAGKVKDLLQKFSVQAAWQRRAE